MLKEKTIIDNLKYSEDWFMKAYMQLKSACGGAKKMTDVDFKEFTEILGCIEDNKQLNDLLEICDQGIISQQGQLIVSKQTSSSKDSKQPPALVCAA